MILVAGATGILGGEICRQLIASGWPIRAIVRPTSDRTKVENLANLGAELVQADLKDKESLVAACKGVDTIVTTVTTVLSQRPEDNLFSVDRDGQINLVDAAKEAGVSRFIYVSFSSNLTGDYPLKNAKRAVEEHLIQSGLNYTVLKPTCFTEFWLGPMVGFDIANAKVNIPGNGEAKTSFMALGDVAKFAVAVIDRPAAYFASLELGGPEALSHNEVVRMCESMSGKKFEVQYLPVEAIQVQADSPDPLQKSFGNLTLAVARGDPIPMADTLAKFPVSLVSVRDYLQQVLGVSVR